MQNECAERTIREAYRKNLYEVFSATLSVRDEIDKNSNDNSLSQQRNKARSPLRFLRVRCEPCV